MCNRLILETSKLDWQSRMDNQETQATLDIRHRTKRDKTKNTTQKTEENKKMSYTNPPKTPSAKKRNWVSRVYLSLVLCVVFCWPFIVLCPLFSKLVRTARFCNNHHQVRSKPKHLKPTPLFGSNKTTWPT